MSKPQIVARAAGLVDQPGEDVDQRRLAGAVGAEQPEDLAARHVEADAVERALAARIGLLQVADRDGGFGHGAANSGTFASGEALHRRFAKAARHGRPIPSRPKSPIPTDARVACDGAADISPALGHPRVWLQIDEKGYVDCGYCDKRFILKGGPADDGS